jgi:hypothetical protein
VPKECPRRDSVLCCSRWGEEVLSLRVLEGGRSTVYAMVVVRDASSRAMISARHMEEASAAHGGRRTRALVWVGRHVINLLAARLVFVQRTVLRSRTTASMGAARWVLPAIIKQLAAEGSPGWSDPGLDTCVPSPFPEGRVHGRGLLLAVLSAGAHISTSGSEDVREGRGMLVADRFA